ncbi:MAG: hypothetical protein R3B89_32985 [Polyangiaceae bacterium]
MTEIPAFESAAVALPCEELTPSLEFFESLGFRLEMIAPADDPSVALLSGYGVRLRLERGGQGDPGVLRLETHDPPQARELQAPNGTRVLIRGGTQLSVPPLEPAFALSRIADAQWVEGRAGMRYRDLMPERQGGRYIASHIQITDGGRVADYVHHHQIHFQLIYVQRGWVEVVYESHGEPILMQQGDCVLQPPHIRHRVLSSSSGLEVVEVACPAAHPTFRDHELSLPTAAYDREFSGQRFIHHIAREASWKSSELGEARDTGLGVASAGLVDVRALRRIPADYVQSHAGELCLYFVSAGSSDFFCEGRERARLGAGDAVAVPGGVPHAWSAPSSDFELLRIASPASLEVRPHPRKELT